MAFTKTLAEMEQSVPESSTREKINDLLDENSFAELDKFLSADGEVSSVVAGYGTIQGCSVYLFAQDGSVKGGAVNKSASLKIRRVYELAAKSGAPVIGMFNSKGGDMNEGMEVLRDYSDILKASAAVSGVVPQIAVVNGVCAGCAAMLAEMADITVMTEDAELFLTSPFNAPDGKIEGAGKAANAAKSGVADVVVKDADAAVALLKKLVPVLPMNNLTPGFSYEIPDTEAAISTSMKGCDLVKALADNDSVVALGKEFGSAACTALASIDGISAAIVSTGRAAKLTAADCAKIARFVHFADAFSIPVVTLVDTEGFEPSSAAELAGSVRDAARLAQVYAASTTVKVNVITGKAFGGAFAAFDSADVTYAWENAQIAPMSPEAGKVFTGEEPVTNPFAAASLGMVDGVIAAADTRDAVCKALDFLDSKRVASPARKHANFVF